MTELDFRILDFIREHFSSGPMDAAMKFFTFLGEAGWFWILIGIVLAAIPKTRRTGVTVLAALLLSLIVCNVTIKPLVGRIRPYDLREGIELMIAGPTDFSFPSGTRLRIVCCGGCDFCIPQKMGRRRPCFSGSDCVFPPVSVCSLSLRRAGRLAAGHFVRRHILLYRKDGF